MAISFPSTPTLNQIYTSGSTSWIWDGTQWTLYINPNPTYHNLTVTNNLTVNNLVADVTGNVTGNLTGNVTGNVSGNAGTVTNGVYTTNTYFNPTWLTSISGSIVSGAINGAAGSAARLSSPVQINGVAFDGSTAITVAAAAATLTGNTLHSTITASSLTSVGTLTSMNTTGIATASAVVATANINVASTTGAMSYGTLAFPDTNVIANFTTNVNSYAQIILENTNSGNAASTDLIVSNNVGSASSYYGDFGINSSGFTGTGSLGLPNAVYVYSANTDLVLGTSSNNPIHFVVNGSATDTMLVNASGITVNGTATMAGSSTSLAMTLSNAAEAVTITSTVQPAVVNFYVATQSILYYTVANATTTNFGINISGSATATLNSIMSIGQSVSIALFVTNGAGAAFPNSFLIDGNIAVTPKWANGILITSGNTNSIDVYNFSIIKTANSTFTVFGSQLKYA